MKFLKLFSKNKEEPEKPKVEPEEAPVQSAITYSIDETGEIFIDVTLGDFNDENIKLLANLLVNVASAKAHLSTMEMLKENFDAEREEEAFGKLVNIVVSQQLLSASEELLARKEPEEPCIKPSDMI